MFKGTSTFFAFLLFSAALGCALASDLPAPACADLLDPVARARGIVSQLNSLPGRTQSESFSLKRVAPDGSTLAYFVYIMEDAQTMNIARIQVQPEFRLRGFNKLLTAQALLENPGTKRIEAALAWSNAEAFYEAFRALPVREKMFHPTRANLKALLSTPFYKICKALGFTKVVSVRLRGEEIDLTIDRADF